MACPKGETSDGFEQQFGTNHLGHFLLTGLLVPALLAGAPARIVNLSSRGHFISPLNLEDPNFEQRDYDKWVAYGQAKTANVLHAVELERRLGGKVQRSDLSLTGSFDGSAVRLATTWQASGAPGVTELRFALPDDIREDARFEWRRGEGEKEAAGELVSGDLSRWSPAARRRLDAAKAWALSLRIDDQAIWLTDERAPLGEARLLIERLEQLAALVAALRGQGGAYR